MYIALTFPSDYTHQDTLPHMFNVILFGVGYNPESLETTTLFLFVSRGFFFYHWIQVLLKCVLQ